MNDLNEQLKKLFPNHEVSNEPETIEEKNLRSREKYLKIKGKQE